MSRQRDAFPMTTSLSPAARILGLGTSGLLRPLLRRGLAPRRRLVGLVCDAIGQGAAGVRVEHTMRGGVSVEVATPPDRAGATTIVYLHGGAYVTLSARSYRRLVTHLALATGCRVVAIDYRLAPEHPYPAALDDVIAVYTAELVDRPHEKIVIAGDSAGGGLTMATAVALRDRGLALPAALVCIAPWVDLTCSGTSMVTRAGRGAGPGAGGFGG